MKFKDVAHLYLGCDVIITNIQAEDFDDEDFDMHVDDICQLTLVNQGAGNIYCGSDYESWNWVVEKEGYHVAGWWGNTFKPILRPLSDITEAEHCELFSIVFKREYTRFATRLFFKANEQHSDRYVLSAAVERLGVCFDGEIWADSDLQRWKIDYFKVTAYLLSKHFDLFGLIEAGEAIDKSTNV